MPRNVSGVYSLPPAYLVGSGDDVLPTQHNSPLEDLEDDANEARPVVAGGTGASTAADARTNLGVAIGSDVQAHGDVLDDLNTLGANSADGEFLVGTGAGALAWESGATARASLGLTIGTDVQAYDAELAALAGLTSAADKLPYFTGSEAAAVADFTAFARTLLDDADQATAQTTLGLGTSNSPTFAGLALTGNLTTTGLIDGRDVAADGTKLDGVEAAADVTDTANVTAAGALMDSELTSEASVKALNQGVATTDSPTFAGLALTGNLTTTGNIDGRDVAADGTKLDGIESGADVTDTANVTAAGALMDSELTSEASVKALNQGVATTDSPTFAGLALTGNLTTTGNIDGRDIAADGTKLDGIEASADVTDTANVTAAGALMDSELTSEASVKALDQGVATTDSPTFAGLSLTGNLTTTGTIDGRDVAADGTKLDGIEASADVTDTANVTAAGALMDSEVSSLSGIKTLTVPDSTTISAFGATLVDDADAATALATLGAQAQDDHLDDLAALTAVSAAGKIMMSSAAGTWAYEDLVGTVSQSGGTPTGAVFEKPVSSANGWVRKTADGFMECWHTLTMTYLSAQSLTATWTLPATFVEAPVPTNARGPTASTTPTNAEVQGAARIHSIDTTSITFQLSRIDGKTDFQSGDTITLYVSAKGRWSALT